MYIEQNQVVTQIEKHKIHPEIKAIQLKNTYNEAKVVNSIIITNIQCTFAWILKKSAIFAIKKSFKYEWFKNI